MHNHTDPVDQSPLVSFLQQIAAQHGAAEADPAWVFANPLAIHDSYWPRVVVIRDAHCCLMRRLSLRTHWTHASDGTPLGSLRTTSRPFGNSDVLGDCAEALGWSSDDLFADEDDRYPLPLREQRCLTLIHDIPACLTVVLQCGVVQPGVFYRRQRGHGYHQAILTLPVLDALCTLAWGTAALTAEQTAAIRQYCHEPEAGELLGLLFDPHEWHAEWQRIQTIVPSIEA